jgi:dihydrofolate reductase
MRKIVLHMSVSLDGFFEGPNRELDWHLVDDELHTHFNEQLAPMSAFLDGRVTYELMAEFWPTADADPASTPLMKGVRPHLAGHAQDRLLPDARAGGVERHGATRRRPRGDPGSQAGAGRDMALGGADLAETFRRHDLIDEYRLYVHPVLLGQGRRLFGPADTPSGLRLVETRTLGNGVVLLRCQRPVAD